MLPYNHHDGYCWHLPKYVLRGQWKESWVCAKNGDIYETVERSKFYPQQNAFLNTPVLWTKTMLPLTLIWAGSRSGILQLDHKFFFSCVHMYLSHLNLFEWPLFWINLFFGCTSWLGQTKKITFCSFAFITYLCLIYHSVSLFNAIVWWHSSEKGCRDNCVFLSASHTYMLLLST